MSNFPAGSKVIVTNAYRNEPYKNGDIFTVKGSSNGLGVEVDHNGEERYLASYEFKAYAPEFKVGDSVVTTASNADWGYTLGDTGVVDVVDTDEPKIRLEGAGYIYSHDLKLVDVASPRKIKVLKSNHPREYEVGDILEVADCQNTSEGAIRVVTKHGITGVVFAGQWEHYTEPAEVKFKVGDTVRLARCKTPGWVGTEGDFVEYRGSLVLFRVTVSKGEHELGRVGNIVQFGRENVEKVEPLAEWEKELLDPNYTPRTIAFADIQKGDKIKAEYAQDDVKYVTEGVADRRNEGYLDGWVTAKGLWVAAEHYENATYTLLERPEPEPVKVNPYAEAKVGSLAREVDRDYTWCKTGEDEWRFAYKGQSKLSTSQRDNAHLESRGTRFELFHIVK